MAGFALHQATSRGPAEQALAGTTAAANGVHGDNGTGSTTPTETALVRRLRRRLREAIDGTNFFDGHAPDAVCMRALVAIGSVQAYFREERANDRRRLLRELRSVVNELDESGLAETSIRSFFERTVSYLKRASESHALERHGGEDEEVSDVVRRIPTMLCRETLGYYKWLARTFDGHGDIVDLGSWMGSSTACLAEGLSQNRCRIRKTVHVYDSFVWLKWMRSFTEDPQLLAADLREGDSFLAHFLTYVRPFRHLISVHRAALQTEKRRFALPDLDWCSGPVGILIMDFAHDRASNEAMWRVFSPGFVSENTIVVFNQFGNVPAADVREFCRERAAQLVPLHKPRSSAKAFRYHRV